MQPHEYGFYANVNPEVDHPRWSQAAIAASARACFRKKRPTLMFNGYADQVASLYAGMDLAKTYLWLDQFFDWGAIVADIAKRPYITVGFAALVRCSRSL
jgi:hypothetical protein